MKALALCPKCKGKHWSYEVNTEDGTSVAVPCVCLQAKVWTEFLSAEIFSAKEIPSELYRPIVDPETNDISGDRTEDDLLIKGTWEEVKRHLKFVLYSKRKQWGSFTFERVTDERLLDVYFSKESFANKPKEFREKNPTFNSLTDLVSPPSLLIIQLGVARVPNKIAHRVLLSALSIRNQLDKPTWLIEGSVAFGDGHLFYSSAVHNFISENYDVVQLGGDVQEEREGLYDFSNSVGEGHQPAPPPSTEAFSERTFERNKSKQWGKPKGKKGGPAGYF